MDAETWHRHLRHIGYRKSDKLVKEGSIPRFTKEFTASKCRICQLTHPRRRKVPTTATRSGKVTVQVDYMPRGHKEMGWKAKVGAYIFSSTSLKIVKAYPVKKTRPLTKQLRY